MKTLFVFLVVFCATLPLQAQTDPASATRPGVGPRPSVARPVAAPVRYLALDVSGPFGGFHRYRFLPGDRFVFRARADGERYQEPLYAVTDSSFSLSMINEVMNRPDFPEFKLTDVRAVAITRRIPFVSAGSLMLPLAGLVFVVADFVNPKSSDGRTGRFVFNSRSLIAGGTLVALGGLCYKVSFPRYTVNKNHRLRVLTAL